MQPFAGDGGSWRWDTTLSAPACIDTSIGQGLVPHTWAHGAPEMDGGGAYLAHHAQLQQDHERRQRIALTLRMHDEECAAREAAARQGASAWQLQAQQGGWPHIAPPAASPWAPHAHTPSDAALELALWKEHAKRARLVARVASLEAMLQARAAQEVCVT
jgi:hypothetical protein